VARFDAETKTSFLDLYTKVDADVSMPVATEQVNEDVVVEV
jgi:hypothetical protein